MPGLNAAAVDGRVPCLTSAAGNGGRHSTLANRRDGLPGRLARCVHQFLPRTLGREAASHRVVAWVESRRGALTARVVFEGRMMEGQVFVPFAKLRASAANFLTNAALDPTSKIPEYKVCAVRVRRAREEDPR